MIFVYQAGNLWPLKLSHSLFCHWLSLVNKLIGSWFQESIMLRHNVVIDIGFRVINILYLRIFIKARSIGNLCLSKWRWNIIHCLEITKCIQVYSTRLCEVFSKTYFLKLKFIIWLNSGVKLLIFWLSQFLFLWNLGCCVNNWYDLFLLLCFNLFKVNLFHLSLFYRRLIWRYQWKNLFLLFKLDWNLSGKNILRGRIIFHKFNSRFLIDWVIYLSLP